MRKKLLALLMCATMVLGTGVTAMAAASDDQAKAIGNKNADLIIAEYYKQAGAIVGTTSNGKLGTVEYGYLAEDKGTLESYTATVVYKDKDGNYQPATQVYSNKGALKAYEPKEDPTGVGFGSTSLETAIEKAIAYDAKVDGTKSNVYVKNAAGNLSVVAAATLTSATITNYGTDKFYDKDGNLLVDFNDATVYTAEGIATKTATDVAAAAGVLPIAVTVTDDLGNTAVVLATTTTAEVVKDGFVSGTKNYVKKATGKKLVQASDKFLKSTNEATFGKIYSNLQKAGETFGVVDLQSIKYAIDSKVFTTDAAAVQITAYLQAPMGTEEIGLENSGVYGAGLAKVLWNATKIQSGSYTFDADLISRTAFGTASAVEVFQPGLVASQFVQDLGGFVVPFTSVATVAVDDTITFENGSTFADGIFVFDKGELAAEPETDANDGVSDKATTDNTTSPKTGDVAPIAALAVVMMGAFGAMVVASKKRA